jgi:tetratricopeptide (TPR) repeat protein
VSGPITGFTKQPHILLKSTAQIKLPKAPTPDELEAAIAKENKLLGADSKDAKAYYRRGLAREKFAALRHLPDGYHAAMEDYNQSLKLDPSNVDAIVHIGDCFAALQDYVAAKRAWDKAIDASPETRELLKDSIAKERYPYAAVRDLTKLTYLEPKNAALYYRKAKLYLTDHATDQANENFRIAAQLEPTNFEYASKAAKPVAPSRQLTADELKDKMIGWLVTATAAAFGAAALGDMQQRDRVNKIIETSGGKKIKCPKCGGSGLAYEETYNSASNPYKMGTWDYIGFEDRRQGSDLRTCDRCEGTGVVDK